MTGTIKEQNGLVGKVVTLPLIDDTLTRKGYAADAKVVGDKLAEIKADSNGSVRFVIGSVKPTNTPALWFNTQSV